MNEKKRNILGRFFRFLTAVIVGGAIGSILGLTLAPKRGQETREFLRDQGEELYQKSRLLWTKRPPEGIQATPVSPFKRILIKAFHLKKTDKLKE